MHHRNRGALPTRFPRHVGGLRTALSGVRVPPACPTQARPGDHHVAADTKTLLDVVSDGNEKRGA